MTQTEQEKTLHRFYRDGAPYMGDFEDVVSKLVVVQKGSSEYLSASLLQLMKDIHTRLADCQAILGKVENMIEDARANNASQEEISPLVDLCLDLQHVQLHMTKDVEKCVNGIVDRVFPR
ncbi:MAG: hypothetical protein GC154_02285 [bacterium]|nr:hypothetical protein [bacterium]